MSRAGKVFGVVSASWKELVAWDQLISLKNKIRVTNAIRQ